MVIVLILKELNTIFGIYNNFFTQGGWCDYTTFSYSFGKFEKNFEITDGEQSFEVEDVEVFKVFFLKDYFYGL